MELIKRKIIFLDFNRNLKEKKFLEINSTSRSARKKYLFHTVIPNKIEMYFSWGAIKNFL